MDDLNSLINEFIRSIDDIERANNDQVDDEEGSLSSVDDAHETTSPSHVIYLANTVEELPPLEYDFYIHFY